MKQAIILESSSNEVINTIISLLKTSSRPSLGTLSLDSPKSQILEELDDVNDGTVIFRDTSFVDNERKIREALGYISKDLQNANGDNDYARHVIAIISRFASQGLDSDLVCRISFDGVDADCSINELQKISEEFDSVLIQFISAHCKTVREWIEKLVKSVYPNLPNKLSENAKNTYFIMLTSLYVADLIFGHKFLNTDMMQNVLDALCASGEYNISASQTVQDDFAAVVNDYLRNDAFKIIQKTDNTIFENGTNTVIIMNDNICFEPEIITETILPCMTTTKSCDKLIEALKECGTLCATNKNRHPISVYDPQGRSKTIHSYSVSCSILDADNREMINNLANQEFFLKPDELPESNFIGLITNSQGQIAGRIERFSDAENHHMYITGQSGYGKTFALSQIILSLSHLNHKLIVFDANDSFTYEALCKNLSTEFVENNITFHNLEDDGVPIDLFNIDDCRNLPGKKNTLTGVLSAATGELSKVQSTGLKNVISDILSLLSPGERIRTGDILSMFDESNKTQQSIKARLESVFEDIDECGMSQQTWEQFFSGSKEVIIITTQNTYNESGNQIIDMLLASLYNHQLNNSDKQLDIIIDEMQNQNLADKSPIWKILREGRKFHMAFIGATQSYHKKGDPVGDVMDKADTKIFLKPTPDSENDIASALRFTKAEQKRFDFMERGDCIISGKCYSKKSEYNRPAVLSGKILTSNR